MTAPAATPAPPSAASPAPTHEPWLLRVAKRVRQASPLKVTLLAFVVGLAFGALLIIVTTPELLRSWGGLFHHPWATVRLNATTVWGDFELLFTGGVFDPRAVWAALHHPSKANWTVALTPLSSTLVYATPLILAGLGLAIGFRTSLFNIGGQGQVIGGAMAATFVGFTFHAAPVVMIPLEIVAGLVGGLLVASVAGLLKAFTGAHEVIVTMMMNYVMLYVLSYAVTHYVFRRPGQNEGESKSVAIAGQLPRLFGWLSSTLQVNIGFLIALVAVGVVWWFMNRSTRGFEFLVVGSNPDAGRTAGINPRTVILWALLLSGALVGLAGMVQVTGIDYYVQPSYGGTIGFDAIVVALLGRNRPIGVLLAALLYGALEAGGHNMQALSSTNIDYSLALVILAVIVFCVATPELIVKLFQLKERREAEETMSLVEGTI